MSVLKGESGSVLIGPRKILSVTYAPPVEETLDTPQALPTAQPASPQKTWTVQSSWFPTFSGKPIQKFWMAPVWASGKNNDSQTKTVSWRLKLNGVSQGTGTSGTITANYFWTLDTLYLTPSTAGALAPGDTIELYLWASATTVDYRYNALQIQASRFQVEGTGKTVGPLEVSIQSQTLTGGGSPYKRYNYGPYIYCGNTLMHQQINANASFPIIREATYNTRNEYADFTSGAYMSAHATYNPYYRTNQCIVNLVWREVSL